MVNALYVMFVHFTIYTTEHNPPKCFKTYIVQNSAFQLLWGFNVNGFGNLVIWLCEVF